MVQEFERLAHRWAIFNLGNRWQPGACRYVPLNCGLDTRGFRARLRLSRGNSCYVAYPKRLQKLGTSGRCDAMTSDLTTGRFHVREANGGDTGVHPTQYAERGANVDPT